MEKERGVVRVPDAYLGVPVPDHLDNEFGGWFDWSGEVWREGVRAALQVPEPEGLTGPPYHERPCPALGDHPEHTWRGIHVEHGSARYWCRGTGPEMTRHGQAPRTEDVVEGDRPVFLERGQHMCSCGDSIHGGGPCPPRGHREHRHCPLNRGQEG